MVVKEGSGALGKPQHVGGGDGDGVGWGLTHKHKHTHSHTTIFNTWVLEDLE